MDILLHRVARSQRSANSKEVKKEGREDKVKAMMRGFPSTVATSHRKMNSTPPHPARPLLIRQIPTSPCLNNAYSKYSEDNLDTEHENIYKHTDESIKSVAFSLTKVNPKAKLKCLPEQINSTSEKFCR